MYRTGYGADWGEGESRRLFEQIEAGSTGVGGDFSRSVILMSGGGLSLIGAERPPCRRLRRNLEQKQNNQAIKVLFLFEKGGAEPSD